MNNTNDNTNNTNTIDITVGMVAILSDGRERVIEEVNGGWVRLFNEDKAIRKSDIIETRQQKGYSMAGHIAKYRPSYTTKRNVTGKKTKICNDPLSQALLALLPSEAIELASNLLDRDGLHDKYAHLNEGQKRMNAGNLIRNAIKREELTMEEVLDAIKHAWHLVA